MSRHPRDPAPHRGDKRLAAKLLGIATRTIYRRLEAEGGRDDGGHDDADDPSGSDTNPDAGIDSAARGRGPSRPEEGDS